MFSAMQFKSEPFHKMNSGNLSLLSDNSMETNFTDLTSPTFSSTSCRSTLSNLDFKSKNQKMKKDACDFVDYMREYQQDPKYKTELCKSFTEQGFCAYGNKCRFAHGKQELFDKLIACKKYKQKECLSFFKNGYCCYGSRCHFKHEERPIRDIERSTFTFAMSDIENRFTKEDIMNMSEEELCGITQNNVFINKERKSAKLLPLFSYGNFQRGNAFYQKYFQHQQMQQQMQMQMPPQMFGRKFMFSPEILNLHC